ncbi:MAG: hypothetical protein ACJAVI_000848 [Candidatus Azotimanducaceae bacterium]|jgi:hypothetical protein
MDRDTTVVYGSGDISKQRVFMPDKIVDYSLSQLIYEINLQSFAISD